VTFLQPESFGSCTSLAAADFNGDGNLDVACAGKTLTVWLGDGRGHFRQAPQALATANALIVAGNFNDDGHADLVVAGTIVGGRNQLVLLPGRGDGTFGQKIPILDLPSSNFTGLAAADLNQDGRLDLAVAVLPGGAGSGRVEAVLGNGDGTFQTPVATGAGAANFTNIAVADFDGDGTPDVISIGFIQFGYTIQVTLGNGDGTFGPPIDTPTPNGPATPAFAVADFTGDGLADVAMSSDIPGTGIYVLQGNGDGTFSPGPVTPGQTNAILLAADLNGDGRPDLVMSGMGIALNQGGGTFAPVVWYQNQLGQGGVAGDFRHLGRPDVVVAGDYYANNGEGVFQAPRSFSTGCGDCWSLTAGDFHNDGNLDAAAVSGSDLRLYAGNGIGGFTGFLESTFTLPNKESLVVAAAADFNGDGNLDLVLGAGDHTYTENQGEAVVLLGNGDGTFGAPAVVYTGYPVDELVTADFNRDGHPDIAIATLYGVIVMCGNGAGGFTTTAAIKNIPNSTSLVTADFNGDGIPDLGTASDVYLGNGDGTFRHSYTLPQAGVLVQTGDFNGDGIPDLVTSDYWTGVVMWPGLGDGTFGPPVTVADVFAPNLPLMAVADLNGDGISDIAVTIDLAATATVYLGGRDGSFTPQSINNLPQLNQFPLSVGDFNNDGRIDLLFVGANGQLMTLINTTK
jgi:hypothetical protein